MKGVTRGRDREISDLEISAAGVTIEWFSQQLRPKAEQAGTEPPWWFEKNPAGDYLNFCERCGREEALTRLGMYGSDAHDMVELVGGYELSADGSPILCEKCEKLLAYALDSTGVEQELYHFFDDVGLLPNPDAEECYQLLALCEAVDEASGSQRDQIRRLAWKYLWDSENTIDPNEETKP